MILCEKPLARNAAEGEKMVAAVEKAGVANMVWYNYRRVPAVTLAKQLVDEGRLGKIFHYRAKFLQDWTISPDLPQGGAGIWRLDVEAAGSRRHRRPARPLHRHRASGSTAASTDVTAMTETFVKERKHTETGKVEKVGIDDACAFLARFANGSLGTFESTRYARGHKALYTFEINGENGSLRLGPARPAPPAVVRPQRSRAQLRGWTSIHVTDGDHPYMGKWWVPGLSIGYEHTFVHQVADFLEGLATGKPAAPTFREALETTKVCDAILKSGKTRAVGERCVEAAPRSVYPGAMTSSLGK